MQTASFFEFQREYAKFGPDQFTNMCQEYGDIWRTQVPVFGKQYYIVHPDDIHAVLVKQAQNFQKPSLIRRFTKGSFGNGLFMSEGDLWKKQRKLMQPHFHHTYIMSYAERMTHHAARHAEKWATIDTCNIDADMHALAFNIVVDVLFSADASDMTDKISLAMHDVGYGLAEQSKSLLLSLLPSWMPHPVLKRKRRGERLLHEMVHQLITERRKVGEENAPQDLLSMLVFSRDEETGETMSNQQIHDELVTLYIAGHETTALLMGWAWTLLSKHPEIEAKLHQELDSVLAGRNPTMADLSNLPYVNWIIKETLRLYPPAWFFMRETVGKVTLRDETLESGCMCYIIPYTTHRDARWFENPDCFMPERWDNDFEKSLPKGAYIPFGLGARVCIGNGLALLEAQLVLATLAQCFRVELIDEPEITKGGVSLGFLNPVRVKLHKR